MRNIISTLVLATIAAGSVITCSAEDLDRKCSAETLKGVYAFRISGLIFSGPSLIYRDGIALTRFDGEHHVTQEDEVLADGVPSTTPTAPNGFHNDETGTYIVHENCTGELELNYPTPPGGTSGAVIKDVFIISDDGRQVNSIVTSIIPPNSTQAVPANIHSDGTRVHSKPW